MNQHPINDLRNPLGKAFYDLTQQVESLGGSPELTAVVVAIGALRDQVGAAVQAAQPEAVGEHPWAAKLIGEWNAAYPRMDINAQRGDFVVFDAMGGYDGEKKRAGEVLKLRHFYEVDQVDIGSCSSAVRLKGVEGWFNTCLFASAPTPEPMSAPTAEPVAWNDTQQASLNDWFLSLPEGRQKVLADDKWMLAGAAFLAGQQVATPPSAATPEPIDAERYRYLRDFYSPPSDEPWDNMDCALAHGGEELDALIDAAIRASKGGKL